MRARRSTIGNLRLGLRQCRAGGSELGPRGVEALAPLGLGRGAASGRLEVEQFEYIFTVDQAATCIPIWEKLGQVTFIGHSHLCKSYALGKQRVYEVITKRFEVHPEFRYIVSVGSVGQPRDHDPRASYTIYDSDRCFFEFKRVEYDISAAAQKIFGDQRLSDSFGARLFAGI